MTRCQKLEYMSGSPEGCTLDNLSSVSKLRPLSQLIPLHPKVKHWSSLLLPWYAFCRTDDSPLTKSNYLQHHVFLGGHPSNEMAVDRPHSLFQLNLDEVDNLDWWSGTFPGTVPGCLIRPSANCLFHFYKRCVS